VDYARREGYKKIAGEYIPTPKNELVQEHYKKLGFTDAGGGFWELDVDTFENFKTHIKNK
jgi:predicted enzyme involved in methoxymalonyl-ACP biosynthesis